MPASSTALRRWLVVMIAPVVLAACGGAGGSLEGTSWRLTDAAGVPASDEAGAFVGFGDDGTVTGTTGCNSFTGPYEADGGSIDIGPLATTLAACPSDSLAAQEAALLAGLESATEWSIAGDILSLTDPQGPTWTFERFEPTLEGAWLVTGYNTGAEAVTSLIQGTRITLEFGDDGTVSGDSGCNVYSGTYEVDGPSLTLGALASTERACLEEGVMEQESEYLSALQATESWQVIGSTLELRDGAGALQVTAQPAG